MKRPSAEALKLAAWQLEQHAEALTHVARWLRTQVNGSEADDPSRVTAASTPTLMTIAEVAKVCRTPVGSIRHWLREGKLPSTRPGRRRMVRREDVEALLRGERGGVVP